jgi:hypothetical protein
MQEESKWEEEWKVVLNNGSEYPLGKEQAWVIQEAIANGNRGVVMFKTFSISIPYIVEFFRVKRFMTDQMALPARATERPWTEEDRKLARERIRVIKEKLKTLNV